MKCKYNITMTMIQEKRWQAELEIIKELNEVPSCRKMQTLLKEKYGIVANHNTVNEDLKKDLETLTKAEYENQKTGILDMLNDEIEIAHKIATRETNHEIQLKAMNTVSKLSKTKSEILIKFKRAQAQMSKEEKSEINVFIGQPEEIDLKKFDKLNGAIKNET